MPPKIPESKKTTDLMTEIPTDIVRNPILERTIARLYDTLRNRENNNPELVNRFYQTYFSGGENLINKLVEIEPNITFEYMKDEGINLALLYYNNGLRDFNDCMNNTSDEVRKAVIAEVFEKIKNEIGTSAPYTDFSTEYDPTTLGSINPTHYIDTVLSYLKEKETASGGKNLKEILKKIRITNDDINKRLPPGSRIDPNIPISSNAQPKETKKSFNALLSFEIGKEAIRTMNIAENVSNKLTGLFSNTFPAINTIIGENEEFKYDEKKIKEFNGIAEDQNLTDEEKWAYYIKYLKSKDKAIGNALEKLKENDFNYSKLEPSLLRGYLKKIANLRLKQLFENNLEKSLNLNFGNCDEFRRFYVNLADPSVKSLNFGGGIILPVEKTVDDSDHPRLNGLEQYGNKGPSYDKLPISFRIKKEKVDELNVPQEDKINLLNFLSKYQVRSDDDEEEKKKKNSEKEYIIDGQNAGSLIYLFFILNSKIPLTQINLDDQKKVETLFGDTRKAEKRKSEAEEEKEKIKDNTDKFIGDVEKLGSGAKFENGSEIWVPIGNSELPGGGYNRMKIKISDIDKNKGTFIGTVSGGELQFKSNLEGKCRPFDMNDKTLNDLKKISKAPDKICLLPNPEKSDFTSFKKKLEEQGNKLGNSSIKFPGGVEWDGKNFIRNVTDENDKDKKLKKEPVEHFGVFGDDSVSYKIKYNPNKHSFNVSTSYIGENKGDDGKSTNTKYSYSRDMDWNNFLIFFTQKSLIPHSAEDSKRAEENQRIKIKNGGKRKLNRFSISNLKNVFKTIKGNISKKIDEYSKAQESKLEDIMIGDRGLYHKLGNILGFIPSMKNSLGELQREYYDERDNRSRKKIEYYYNFFQKDPDFGTTFDQLTPFARRLWNKSYKEFIVGLFESKRKLGEGDIQMAAALLLANIEKGGSPYRGLSEYENSGLWVKVLFGDDHYQQFLRDKAACENARNLAEDGKGRGLDKDSLNSQLATCEMDYIINNIKGAYGKAKYSFGSIELRGLNGDPSTNYIDSPSKSLFSVQYASKLDSAAKGWYSASSVDECYGKYKTSITNFEKAEDEFNKMGSSRYQNGAAALRTMIDLASDDSLRWRTEKCFLTYLLCGALDVYCDKGLKKQVYERAKPMSFVPGLLVKERNVAENVAILLDDAFNGDFSRNVTKYYHKEYLGQGRGIDFKGVQEQLNEWLTEDKMEKLHEYFRNLPTKKFLGYSEPNKTILEKFKASLISDDRGEIDRRMLDNPVNVNNGLTTNIEVISNRLQIRNGEFEGTNSNDIKYKRSFWVNVKKDVDSKNVTDPDVVNFVLDTYLNRFGIRSTEDRQDVFKWINTAAQYRRLVDSNGGKFKCHHTLQLENGNKMRVPLGDITHDDVNKTLLYALEGRVWQRLGGGVLPPELREALDSFQDFFYRAFKCGMLNHKIVKDGALKSGNLGGKDTLLLGGWDAYKKITEKEVVNTSDDIDDSTDATSYNDLTHSKRKEALRRVFKNEDHQYVNPKMETIYKSLTKGNNSLGDERTLKIDNNTDSNPQDWDLTRLYDSLYE